MPKFPLNPAFKPHFFLALFLGIWLVVFLIFIGPFDLGEISFRVRFFLVPPYGLLFLISYLILIPIQNWAYKKNQGWNGFLELGFVITLFIINFTFTYCYYKTPIVNGTYSFSQFLAGVFSPIFFLIIGLLVISRWLLVKLVPVKMISEKLLLRGDNKSDQLQVLPQQVVCISSAQNYVEVFYRSENGLKKKLLRTTLKKISASLPHLIQVHRSHMINPNYFSEWTDSSNILIEELQIPVSKNYKSSLEEFLKSRP